MDFADFYIIRAKTNPETETPVLGHEKTESKITLPPSNNLMLCCLSVNNKLRAGVIVRYNSHKTAIS